MIAAIKFIFNKVPAQWWRNGARGILTSAFTFYILSISEHGIVDRYLAIFIRSLFWRYTFIYLLVFFVFYCVLDFLLRYFAIKILKEKFIVRIREENSLSKFEVLRGINEVKNGALNFLMGYPVKLGYITSADLREIGTTEPINVSPEEKDKAIVEVITALNKWACVMIHLVMTMLLVWKYDKILLISIFVVGFFLTSIVYIAIMFFIHNAEIISAVIQKEFKRKF